MQAIQDGFGPLLGHIEAVAGVCESNEALKGIPFMDGIVEKMNLTLLPLSEVMIKLASLDIHQNGAEVVKSVVEAHRDTEWSKRN